MAASSRSTPSQRGSNYVKNYDRSGKNAENKTFEEIQSMILDINAYNPSLDHHKKNKSTLITKLNSIISKRSRSSSRPGSPTKIDPLVEAQYLMANPQLASIAQDIKLTRAPFTGTATVFDQKDDPLNLRLGRSSDDESDGDSVLLPLQPMVGDYEGVATMGFAATSVPKQPRGRSKVRTTVTSIPITQYSTVSSPGRSSSPDSITFKSMDQLRQPVLTEKQQRQEEKRKEEEKIQEEKNRIIVEGLKQMKEISTMNKAELKQIVSGVKGLEAKDNKTFVKLGPNITALRKQVQILKNKYLGTFKGKEAPRKVEALPRHLNEYQMLQRVPSLPPPEKFVAPPMQSQEELRMIQEKYIRNIVEKIVNEDMKKKPNKKRDQAYIDNLKGNVLKAVISPTTSVYTPKDLNRLPPSGQKRGAKKAAKNAKKGKKSELNQLEEALLGRLQLPRGGKNPPAMFYPNNGTAFQTDNPAFNQGYVRKGYGEPLIPIRVV